VAVVTLAVGLAEQDMVGKQVGAVCNLDVRVSEEVYVGKQDGAVRIGI
jgi:hypothetical protein